MAFLDGVVRRLGEPRWRVMIGACLVLVLVAGSTLIVTFLLGRRTFEQSVDVALDRSLTLQSRWLQTRLFDLESSAESLATLASGWVQNQETEDAEVSEDGTAEEGVRESLDTLVRRSRLDIAGVFHSVGAIVVHGGRDGGVDGGLAQVVRELGRPGTSEIGLDSGLVSVGEGLYAVVRRVDPPVDEEGAATAVVVARRIDREVIRNLAQTTGAELAYLLDSPSGPVLSSTTLNAVSQERLLLAVRSRGSWQGMLRDAQRLSLSLADRPWAALLAPLPGIEGEPVGVAAALTADQGGSELPVLLLFQFLLGLLGLLLLAALVGREQSRMLRPLTEPLARLTSALEEPKGELAQVVGRSVEGAPDEVRRLAAITVARLEQAPESAPEEPTSGPVEPRFERTPVEQPLIAAVEEMALMVVDFRGLARAETVKQPEVVLARTRRDLDLIRAVSAQLDGTIEAWSGHRLLVSFAGEHATIDAVRAGAGVLDALSRPDSAFEDARPPAVVLVRGLVAAICRADDAAAGRALFGRPLQQLDDLLREAAPGDLLLSNQLVEQIGTQLRDLGVALHEHRGLLTTQSLWSLEVATAESLLAARQGADGSPD